MQGIVKERAQTDSGAKYIMIDRQRYYFDRSVSAFPEVGAKIDFEWHEFGEAKGKYGKPRSISAWKPVTDASGKPETGSTITDADILRSVSNVVGSACAAGTVTNAEDLEKWFVAAWAGFTRRTKAMNGKVDPELNDDLPDGYHESENPAPRNNGSGPSW